MRGRWGLGAWRGWGRGLGPFRWRVMFYEMLSLGEVSEV